MILMGPGNFKLLVRNCKTPTYKLHKHTGFLMIFACLASRAVPVSTKLHPRDHVVSAVSAVTDCMGVISTSVTLCPVQMKVRCANSGDLCRPPDCRGSVDRLFAKKNPTGYPRLP